MKKQIAVIGLGRFGENLCLELMSQDIEVLAIDQHSSPVKNISPMVSQAVIANASDERVIEELKLASFHAVVVTISNDIGTSILMTICLKEAGVKEIWVKSRNKLHSKTLLKVGASKIINPELTEARRTSRQLLSPLIFDFVELSENLAIYELNVLAFLHGQSVAQLKLHNDIQLLALHRGEQLLSNPASDMLLERGDIMIIGGQRQALKKLIRRLSA